MKLYIGGRRYRIAHRGRFIAFAAAVIAVCVAAGYCISGAAWQEHENPAAAVGASVQSMNRLAVNMTGNR